MKVAVFSDVHANLPALEAVIEHAHHQGVQEFWDLGDSVGYSPFPNEVLDVFRREKVKSVLGNYDKKVLIFPLTQKKWRKQKAPAKYFSFSWAHQCLSKDHKHYLARLPGTRRIRRSNFRFLLVHASPLDIDEIVSPRTSCKRFGELAKAARANIVLFGHSHFFMDRMFAGTRFINPGSVGRSFDGKQEASYVLLDIGPGAVKAKRYRLSYDLSSVVAKMRKGKFPKILIESIRLGRSIDELEQRRSAQKDRVVP